MLARVCVCLSACVCLSVYVCECIFTWVFVLLARISYPAELGPGFGFLVGGVLLTELGIVSPRAAGNVTHVFPGTQWKAVITQPPRAGFTPGSSPARLRALHQTGVGFVSLQCLGMIFKCIELIL